MNPPKDSLLIIGAGQYGLVALEIAQAMGCFDKIAFLDDSFTGKGTEPAEGATASPTASHPERSEGSSPAVIGTTRDSSCHSREGGDLPSVIGSTRDISQFATDFRYGFVAIGNPQVRARLVEQLKSSGIAPATLVHPTAYVSPSAQLQKGCSVEPLAVMQTGAILGTATFVASGAVIRHNATVGDFCHIDCNAVVQTGASVPNDTKVPCNSVFGTGFAPLHSPTQPNEDC